MFDIFSCPQGSTESQTCFTSKGLPKYVKKTWIKIQILFHDSYTEFALTKDILRPDFIFFFVLVIQFYVVL